MNEPGPYEHEWRKDPQFGWVRKLGAPLIPERVILPRGEDPREWENAQRAALARQAAESTQTVDDLHDAIMKRRREDHEQAFRAFWGDTLGSGVRP